MFVGLLEAAAAHGDRKNSGAKIPGSRSQPPELGRAPPVRARRRGLIGFASLAVKLGTPWYFRGRGRPVGKVRAVFFSERLEARWLELVSAENG